MALALTQRPRRWMESFRSWVIDVSNAKSLRDPALVSLFGRGPIAAGVTVNEWTAMNYSAFWDAVQVIAGDMAALPIRHFKRDGASKVPFVGSALYDLLDTEANPETSTPVFVETLQAHVLSWGNGYAEIERDGLGRPKYLWQITPDRVRPDRVRGEIVYRVRGDNNTETVLPAADMLHIPGLAFDGLVGYSPAIVARESIGVGLAAEKFTGSFYGNGATFGGFLSVPEAYNEERLKAYQAQFGDRHQGPDKAHKLGILWNGMQYQKVGVDPNVAQLLETRRFQIEEVARWFNLPPHKLKDLDRATNNNIEQQDLQYYKGCLIRWIRRWEKELSRKCIPRLERRAQFVKFNVDGLLRGDIQSRFTALGIARDKGIINADEWRDLEDMNPQPDGQGQLYLVQSAQVPVNKLEALVEAQIQKSSAPPEPPPVSLSPEDTPDRAAALEALLVEARAEAATQRALRESVEATAGATAEELAAARASEAEAVGRVQQAEVLIATLRTTVESRESEIATLTESLADVTQSRQQALESAAATTQALVETKAEAERLRGVHEEAQRVSREALDLVEARATDLATWKALVESTRRDLDDAQARHALAESQAAASVADAEARLRVGIAAAHDAREADQRAAEAEHRASQEASRLALEQAQQAVTDALARLSEAESAKAAADADRQQAEERATATRSALAEAHAEASRLQERADLSDREVARLTQVLHEVAQELEAAKSHETHAKTTQAETETRLQALSAAEAASQAALREALRTDEVAASAVITAHRALTMHIMRAAIERETDRAKRHQATPEKLRHWMSTWYDSHAELMTAQLLPAVKVHLAWIRSDEEAGSVTRALVEAHVETSRRQLQAVLDGDAASLAGSLAGLLHRWEEERVSVIPDRLMAAEVEYVTRRRAA